ncbi:prepilin-type N-terminal cleavage/methylation domain-containing protein [Gimesia maris]|uniref:prepilin-type N-terminal cleavage/methylation domain-containing protein n=1 Tax=Gimesia maris TaxID=122 RepID=UPI003A91888D
MKRRPPITLSASKYSRRAFTLIELMIAIVIILILIGLLVPAIGAVRLRAQQAKVRSEISNLEASIALFKSEFGMDPPSGIILYESGSATWDQRSKGLIRQLWPQFDFTANKDINGDGDVTDTILLNAGECLTFFLGGVWEKNANGNYITFGFSKNPAKPFLNPGHTAADPGYDSDYSATNSGRQGPFFEFDNSRFVDTDGDNAPEYLDSFPSQQTPYIYLSSYEGRGYRTGDITGTGLADVYRQGDPTVTPPTTDPPYKPKSFQIISPGADYQLGTGGNYTSGKNLPGNRSVEADNITNFVSGSLQ